MFSDKKIIESWRKNVQPWVRAIGQGEVVSRVEVTNSAIIEAILRHKPSNLLDVGCGEGWLIREISKSNIQCTGIDVIPEFSEHVKKSGGRFKLLAYEDFGPQAFEEKFDVIACNFSLLGKESVENVIEKSVEVLKPNGTLIVQTIHPIESSSPDNYQDGWREGSWQGFAADFVDPAPWYFRTVESWEGLFISAGFDYVKLSEPCHPQTGIRMSAIFEAKKSSDS